MSKANKHMYVLIGYYHIIYHNEMDPLTGDYVELVAYATSAKASVADFKNQIRELAHLSKHQSIWIDETDITRIK